MFRLFGPDKTFKFKRHYYSSLMHNNEELDKFYGNMSGCFLSIIPQKKNRKNISELVVDLVNIWTYFQENMSL